MRYSIFVAIMLIFVSGFVAYFGDLLGRRMGKKRLTLMGLRPRYTAIVVTTITGMVISALALITLISANKPFQLMWEQGDKIIDRNQSLMSKNSQLEAKNSQMIARSRELEKEVAIRRKEVEAARKEVEAARKGVQNALKVRDAALQARNEAVKARDAAAHSIARLENDIAARHVELAALRKKNDAAEKEMVRNKVQLADVRRRLDVEQAELLRAQVDLNEAQEKFNAASAKLSMTQDKLAKADEALKEQEAAIAQQQEYLREQLGKIIDFGNEANNLRSRELVVRRGEELVRGVISSGMTAFGVKGDLLDLLDQASKKAESLGAKKGDHDRAVRVVFRQITDNGVVTSDDEAACIDTARDAILERMARDAISGTVTDAMVQVVCADNTIAGEQVPVEFRLYLNNQVFRSGRLVASTKLDGNQSEGRILLAVIDFLRKDVSEAALRAGIIPVANPDPRASLGKDPANQVEALMAVVDQIKAADAPVKVEAYTSGEVYAAGPLSMDNLRFKVIKLE